MSTPVEITTLAKAGGPLTKRISLVEDGSLHSDGSACVMSRGSARRIRFDGLATLAEHIAALDSNEAIALGTLRPDLPDQVEIVTKDKLAKMNGAVQPGIIARTGGHITYAPGRLALALLDFDTKGMPPSVADRLNERGGYWPALVSVLPDPSVTEGAALDTVTACPPLTIVEQAKVRELFAKEKHRLTPDAAKGRGAFIAQQSERLVERTSMSAERATQVIARQCAGILLPDVTLPFDHAELTGVTVADVLADPARFEGATLADPLEGVEYGVCKAKIMRRADGTPWIHSFAHGRTVYELKLDAGAVEAALNKAPANEVAAVFVRLALAAELGVDELEHLRDLASQRAGVTKPAIERKLKAAWRERAAQGAQERRDQRAAERQDPRPQI
jgi:hypothetical protein